MKPPKIDLDAFFASENSPAAPAAPRDEVLAASQERIVRDLFEEPPSPAAAAAAQRVQTQAVVQAFPRATEPTADPVRQITTEINDLLELHRQRKIGATFQLATKRPRGRPRLSARAKAQRASQKRHYRNPDPPQVRGAIEFTSIAALAALSHTLPYHTWQALQRSYNLWFRADDADLLTAKQAGTLLAADPQGWPAGFELAVALLALRVLNRDKRARPAVVLQEPDAAFHLVEPYLARLAGHPDEDLRFALPVIAQRAAHYSGPGSTALHRWLREHAAGV